MYMFDSFGKLSSRNVPGKLPSALKNQVARDAKSIYRKFLRGTVQKLPLLKKPVSIWNNQNYTLGDASISFPVWDGKSSRLRVKALITDEQYSILRNCKPGTLRITQKGRKWIAQIAVETSSAEPVSGGAMGLDLGIKVPAVCYTDNGKIKFVGNGRKIKALKRRYASKRKRLQKAGKGYAVRKLGDKENRVMRDIDHKLSREIVGFAISNGIGIIKLEMLQNIRQQARKSRKNNRSLHSWSFYRLVSYIEYKAKLAGINVEYVNPAYTSQKCPACGSINHAEDRSYSCACGFRGHRDIVGARNILAA